MSDAPGPWRVRRTAAADSDLKEIVRWTRERFGDAQALAYGETLSMALASLHAGPATMGVKRREDVLPGLCTLHVARSGRKGRHFIMFRVAQPEHARVIEVLRLLHDSMDLPTQLVRSNMVSEPAP